MSIWLKNEVEKLSERVRVLEEAAALDASALRAITSRLEQLESPVTLPKKKERGRGEDLL